MKIGKEIERAIVERAKWGANKTLFKHLQRRKMLSALSAELYTGTWWLHAAGLFCKCHSFGRRARAVVKTNLVGIARFFNTLVFIPL